MKVVLLLFLGLFIIACSSKNVASDNSFTKRVALVIGNESYPYQALDNPINDAKGIVEVLLRLEFKRENIIFATDVNATQFYSLLEEFQKKIDHETIAFIYFSGHANTLHSNSTNSFLLMVDPKEEASVSIHKIYEVLEKSGAKHNIICIDACRDYKEKSKDDTIVNRGGRIIHVEEEKALPRKIYDNNHSNPPISTIVSFAASINQIARDKGTIDKNHSPYARYLIRHLDDPKIPVSEVFNRVRVDLRKELNGTQRNMETGALEGNPWLNPKRGDMPVTAAF